MKAHQRSLLALLSEKKLAKMTGAEIGVWRGHTSQILLENLRLEHLYLVDSWAVYPEDHPYRNSGDTVSHDNQDARADQFAETVRRTRPFQAAQIIATTSLKAATMLRTNLGVRFLDFAFIDADHTEQAVADDIKAWWPLVKVGGILCGHDYSPRIRCHRGVIRAVDKFCKTINQPVNLMSGSVWWVKKKAM